MSSSNLSNLKGILGIAWINSFYYRNHTYHVHNPGLRSHRDASLLGVGDFDDGFCSN